MTLCHSTSPHPRHRSREGQCPPPVEPSHFTPSALSMQERACSHGIAPSHLVPPTPSGRGRAGNDVSRFVDAPRLSKQGRAQPQDIVSPRLTPPAPSKRGRGSVHRLSSLHALTLPALSEQERARSHDVVPHASTHRTVCAGRAMFTGCCTVIRHLIRFVRTGKGMARPAAWHIQSPRLLRGLCENSIQLFSRGSLASSGKDHFHNWKEQSCLSVRMDTSPSENLNFSAQLSIQERTRQAMCSVPASKWYNGIAS